MEEKIPEASSSSPAENPPRTSDEPREITLKEFSRVVLKTGLVLAAEAHKQADRLLVLKVDLGEAEPRQLVAGIRSDWEPEELVGRTIIVVANLKPARLRGVESQGMLLAVRGEERVLPLGVEGRVPPGTRVS